MIVVHRIEDLAGAISGSVVTIGNFDGVHKGHQRLIGLACSRARGRGLLSVAVTFEPHPIRFFTGKKTPPFITPLPHKLELMADLGLEAALVLPFNRDLAAMAPDDFVARILVDGLRVKDLVIGYDYAFGRNRAGNFELLSRLGAAHGFSVERIDPVIIGEAVVSSTRIRDLVEAGQVWEASELLGRFHRIGGTVVHGAKRGASRLGFPTANLATTDELLPRPGVYAVWAQTELPRGEMRPAVANIGVNPTFTAGQPGSSLSIEAHLLDFSRDLYGQAMRLHFVQRIRDERRFAGVEELKARIAEDVRLGRQILDSAPTPG